MLTLMSELRKKGSFIILFISLMASKGSSQPIVWDRSYGGSENDLANSLALAEDGGYFLAGKTGSSDGDLEVGPGMENFWVVKADTNGSLQWQRSLGGHGRDEAYSVTGTKDGGCALAGFFPYADRDIDSSNGNGDAWVVKLSSNGELQWEANFGGSSSDLARSIIQTEAGGYAVAGHSNSKDGDLDGNNGSRDMWVFKLNKSGELRWQKHFGGSRYDGARAIAECSEGFLIAGYTESSDGDVKKGTEDVDAWLLKLDGQGGLIWERTYSFGGADYFKAIEITNDGGYALSGKTRLEKERQEDERKGIRPYDLWTLKVESDGDPEWHTVHGGKTLHHFRSWVSTPDGDITQMPDGSYAVLNQGGTPNNPGLIRLDSKGKVQNAFPFRGFLSSLASTPKGELLIGGSRIKKIDEEGNKEMDFRLVKLFPQ